MFRAVVLADGDELTTAEFPQIAAQVEGFDVEIPPVAAAVQPQPAAVRPCRDRRISSRATPMSCG